MGTDNHFIPFFQPDTGNNAPAHMVFPLQTEIMLVQIDGGNIFRH